MSFGDEIGKEFGKIDKKADTLIRSAVVNLRSDLVESSPVAEVKGGELKASWEQPKKSGNAWVITNIAPHAVVIDGGRREIPINGKAVWVGSEQLLYGFAPIIAVTEKQLKKRFSKL